MTPEERKNRQVAFMLVPHGDRTELMLAIPDGAWDAMRDYRAIEFNLVNVGISLALVMTRCPTRADGLRLLRSRGMLGPTNPRATEEWILLAFGTTGSGVPLVMLLIPEAARRGMVGQERTKHSFDLREQGFGVVIQMLARPTFADCMAEINAVVSGPVRDLSDRDLSFDRDSGVRH